MILRQAVCSVPKCLRQHHIVMRILCDLEPPTVSESQKYKSYLSETICLM